CVGGSGSEAGLGGFGGPPIAVDANGNAYVTGSTSSTDFPVTANAFQVVSGGGFFRSSDSGNTWNAGNAGLTSFSTTSIVIDPQAPANTLYVSTNGSGVFRSTDGGATWSAVNGSGGSALGSLNVEALILDPTTRGATASLFAGTQSGAFKSTDAGATWTLLTGLTIPGTTIPADIKALAINHLVGTPATLFAGGFSGAFKSVDGGTTWTSITSGFSPSFPGIQQLVIDPTSPATVYAATPQGVYKSLNGGTTWTSFSSGLTTPGTTTPLDVQFLAIDFQAPTNLY